MARTSWAKDWTVGVRVWIERHGQAVLGQGRAELMDAIGRHRSITAAAKAAGMSYRRAWSVIQELNEAAGETLVRATVGGVKGGGAQLTERGRFAIEVYQRLHLGLHESAADVLRRAISPTNALPCVHLAAAISLQEVLGQLLAEYALRQPTVQVRAVYGASNELADHLLAGAPGDLFISADPSQVDRLEAAKKLVPRSRRTVAFNGLAAIGPHGSKATKLTDLLTQRIRHVALAEPACPLGAYSKAYLEKVGVYEQLLPNVVHVDNSRGLLSAMTSGIADAGLAFESDSLRWDCQTLFRVPHSQAAAEYVGGIVRGGPRQGESQALLDFITSTAAARVFRRCGFRPRNRA
jgi:molybdenum ABC transporter molybdate-binding protein